LGSQAESSVVRRRGSVMTNRVLSQDGIAERSAVTQIRLEDRGCRPKPPASPWSRKSPGWKPWKGVQQVRLQMEPNDWQTVPRLQGRVHRTSILRQPVVPVIARWLATGWRLTLSVARPQGWTAWRVDTRQQKDLAARRGADVGSWTEALPGRKVGWRGRPTPANRKDLAARQGVDVGSWTEALPGRKVG